MGIIETALGELAKNSPLVALIGIFIVAVVIMFRSSIKSNKEAYNKAIDEIQKSHAVTVDELRRIINRDL